MSHTKFPEVVLHDDDGDGDLAAGAPMLVEALQLVESAQMFSAALRIAHHAEQLSAFLDTQRGANSSPSYTAMRAEAELKEQTQRHRNLLDSVRASFSTLQSPPETNNSQSSAHRQHFPKDPTCHAFARRADGLVLPQGVQLREMLLSQPFLDYERYTHCVRRLSDIVSDGKMFSACEPRLRILQGRHALFRAFSGWREDHYHPTLGGGDLACAPQSDLRRLETSVGASALVAFMEHLRQHEPQRLVSASPPITVKKVMERYFGPTAPYPGASTPAAVTLSADGLGLRPNYAEDGGGPWLDMQDLARHAKEQPKGPSTQAAELLNAFIGMKNVEQDGSHQGELFAEFVVPALTRVVKSRTHPNASLDRLHLELTLTGREAGELQRIATWCARSGLYEKTGQQMRFCLLISQKAFLRSAEEAPATTPATGMEWGSLDGTDQPTLHFGHVLKHIFEPMWQALQEPAQHPDLAALLSRTTGISLSFDCSATVQEMPMEGKVEQFPLNGPAPPDAFFAFHVWRNVMMLNAMFSAHAFFQSPKPVAHEGDSDGEGGQGNLFTYFLPARSLFRQHRSVLQAPLMLRLHGGTGSRGLFMESVLGLLMADEIVNPAYTFEWSPLTYLYYLTQRHVVLSPSRNRRSSSSVKDALSGALPLVVQLGLHASIATIDPLFDGSGSFALSAEFEEVRKNYNLSTADVTEMSLRGLESRWTSYRMEERYLLWGFAWPRASPQENAFEATHVSALRLHHRDAALEHEMALVCRKGLRDAPMMMACQVPEVWATSTGTSLSSADGLTREERWRLLKSFFAIPSIKETPAGTSAMTWTPPQPLPPILHTQSSERSMLFPRIIIAGPDRSEPHRASKQVARALSRRQYYQSFAHMAEEGSVLRRSTSSSPAAADGTSSINPLHDGLRLPQHFAHGKNGLLDVSLTAEEKHSAITANYFAALPSWEVFQQDVRQLREVAGDATVQRYCRKRLDMLECKFKLHVALTNDDQKDYNVMLPVPDTTIGVANEAATRSFADAGSKPPSSSRYAVIPARKFGGDVYNCVKVDVHCHMAGGMTAKSLLDFIKRKLHSNADDVVAVHAATGQSITLASLFAELLSKGGPTTAPRLPHQKSSGSPATSGAASSCPYISLTDLRLEELTIASLQVQAGKATFNRFDQFNNRYNPMGISSLRSLFLKTENFMGGRYFAELIQETLDKQSQEGKTFSEYRLSIYGRDAREWERLANWFVLHGMAHQTNRWMVQVPRLFGLYRKQGILDNFQQMLHNIFAPLWEASIHPERHPFLHHFLAHVSGFDSVDNESDREQDQVIRVPPGQWTRAENPPFSYYMYFMWANCVTLNRYRAAKGLSTFSFRPHAGESGDPDHMADALLLADGVGHGINLIKRPVLQYLFYLSQIPLGIVPLSNNALFCKYADNPFPTFFRRGLNVALATDGALMFHHTEQPLIEEYSTAQNFWGLSAADICEIAKHSVVMSGFPRSRKEAWLGSLYALRSVAGNDESRSCVPMTRCAFRYEVYLEECAYLEKRAAMEVPRWEVRTPLEEELFTLRRLGLTRNEVVERRWSGKSVEHPSSASSRGCDATSEGLTPYRNSYRPSRL